MDSHTIVKALVVEDNDIAKLVATLVLKGLNCEVDSAGCAATAIELAMQNDYDIIFMDIGLPDTSGLEATQVIRKMERKHVPIVALTAHSKKDLEDSCHRAGMDDFLVKPITEENAISILKRYVYSSR